MSDTKVYKISVPAKASLFGLIVSIFMILSSILIYKLTDTYNVLAILIPSLLSTINPLYAITLQKGSASKRSILLTYIASIIILAISVGLGIFMLIDLKNNSFKPTIVNPQIAVSYLLATIIIVYIGNIFVEKLCGDLHWRVGRLLSEDLIAIIYSSTVGIIGPTLAFFGVNKLDSYLAIFTILVSLIPLRGKVSSVYSIRRTEEFNKMLETKVRDWISKLPVIKSLDTLKVQSIWLFAWVHIEVSVSQLIKDRENDLVNTLAVPIIDSIGTIVSMEIIIRYPKTHEIVIAVTVKDKEEVSEGLTDNFAIIKVDNLKLEVISRDSLTIEITSEIPESTIIRSLAENHVDILCTRKVYSTIKNLADGWFISILEVKSTNVDGAIEEALSFIRSKLL